MSKDNLIFKIILGIIFVFVIVIMFLIYKEVKTNMNRNTTSEDGNFGINFIKQSNEDIGHNNYMISPYSVEIALSMLREGANNTTFDEMNSVVPERTIKSLDIKNKVNIANGLFIKNNRKDSINKEFINTLKDKYNSEVIYDDFAKPDKINDWVNKKTNKMIPKILESMNPNFVLGLANAIAFEEDWKYPFECKSTSKQEFKTINNDKIDVSMMYKSFEEGIYYFEDDNAKGVVLPYKNYSYDGVELDEGGEQLEFIGILTDDIDDYINRFNLDVIGDIDNNKKIASDSFKVNVSLPRFEFDYDFKDFKKSLIEMKLEETFSELPDFSRMVNTDVMINEAIHKTYVKVDEKGTKAAAVTYFGTKDNAVMESEYIDIVFDKPFIFMIKDTTSNEILFFGVVYEPEKWSDKACD